jgi:5-formyltetrahydrofolate cyclo-ligase
MAMVLQDKAALRAEARAVRRSLADVEPEAASRAAGWLSQLPPADLVAIYRAIGSELDPEPLGRALIAAGHHLCLPVALERDTPMIFRRWSPGDPLEVDAAGCPAPLQLSGPVDPDLILTPLLAFDAFGGRLGQGGGYYDRTFAARPDALRIGFGYLGQQVARLPMESHDIRLHGVLTEVGYTAARKV